MYLRQFNLNLLVALHALLNHRNVARAADEVGVTQSAMSGELRRLRRIFGDELLVRVGREYELTALAQELVDPVREIIVNIEQTIARRPCFDPATDARAFTMAMSDFAMLVLLEPLLHRLGGEAPRVTLHVHPLQSDAVNSMLGPGGVDLLIYPDQDPGSAQKEVLFVDRWVCAVGATHPEVGDRLTLDQYRQLPAITYGVGAELRRSTADRYLRSKGIHAPVEITTESFALAPFLLTRTRMVAMLQERLARRLQTAAGIKLLDPPIPTPDLTEAMFWSPVADADPAHRWLRQTLREVAQEV
jgi:LysR family nod box-dependent transcriptional activator